MLTIPLALAHTHLHWEAEATQMKPIALGLLRQQQRWQAVHVSLAPQFPSPALERIPLSRQGLCWLGCLRPMSISMPGALVKPGVERQELGAMFCACPLGVHSRHFFWHQIQKVRSGSWPRQHFHCKPYVESSCREATNKLESAMNVFKCSTKAGLSRCMLGQSSDSL